VHVPEAGTLNVATPVLVFTEAPVHVAPSKVKVAPAGGELLTTWSLLPRLRVAPEVLAGKLTASSRASTKGTGPPALLAVLFAALLSLLAPAVTVKVTPVSGVLPPPWVPGAVKAEVQVMLAPAAREATGTDGLQTTPETSPAEAAMLQVALAAGSEPALVQEKLKEELPPGAKEGGTVRALATKSAGPARSAVSRATKASELPPPELACAPPVVWGKLVDQVSPAT
jgi:hypothetical protein